MKLRSLCHIVIVLCVAGMAVACANDSANNAGEAARSEFVAQRNLVDTMLLKKAPFSKEIISNGNLRAVNKAALVFGISGEVEKVFRKNGESVKKGDTVAVLNTLRQRLALNKAKNNLEKAELDFYDNLLGFGYGKDTSAIPADVVKVAAIRSGYISAKQDLASAELDMANAAVIAPFNGVVANLEMKPYEQAAEVGCSIIDNSRFDIDFNLLESELNYISLGQSVRIVPYINPSDSYNGKISSINPMVDDKGQVKITASLSDKAGNLIDGMNVKIFIESAYAHKLIVPKNAVVVRDGYDVLFTYNPSTSKAEWVYVDILESNSTHHVVCGNEKKNAQLDAGAIVIVSGNLNLSEGSNVEIKR